MTNKIENATNVNRVPKTKEIFNAGKQPSIPTRGLSSILSAKPAKRKLFKFSLHELKNNEFKHVKDHGV